MFKALTLTLFAIGAGHAATTQTPFHDIFFEPSEHGYIARTAGATIRIAQDGLQLQAGGAAPVHLRFSGANPNARFEPLEQTDDRSFYFIGSDSSQWRRGIPHYLKLAWRDAYPGIDVIFYGKGGRLEFDLLIAPGADPRRVELTVDRPARLDITAGKALQIGSFEIKKPEAYQLIDGVRHEISTAYRLAGTRAKLSVGKYDRTRTLVIDPVIAFATYFGGDGEDAVAAVTAQGDVIGSTNSLNFGPAVPNHGKDIFILVSLFSGASAYIFAGGADDDVPTCAFATSNALLVGGWTRSTDFMRPGGYGGEDGFLLSFNRSNLANNFPAAPGLARIGGSGNDRINALTAGWFAGETTSPDLTYGAGPLATHWAGGSDAFLGMLSQFDSASVGALAYFGGSGDDAAYAVIRDKNGAPTIGGKTTSTDLPLRNSLAAQLRGDSDGFLASFTLESPYDLTYSTYLGGSGSDEVRALATNYTRTQAYFAGTTTSTDLPLVNAAQTQYGGGESDAFVGQLDLTAGTLVFNTYLGGTGRDEATALDVALIGLVTEPVVAGSTTSTDLPVINPVQDHLNGPQDAFLANFTSTGALQSLTYYGGTGSDRALALSVSNTNVATIGGATNSTDLPQPAINPTYSLPSGGSDGFTAGIVLTRFDLNATTIWTAKDMIVQQVMYASSDVPDTAIITLTSSDPSRVLVSFCGIQPGASTMSVPMGAVHFPTSPTVGLCVTGASDSGEAMVTVALQGFPSQQLRVRLGQPAIYLSFGTTASATTSPVNYTIYGTLQLGVVNDSGQFFSGIARPGVTPAEVSLALSDSSVATLSPSTVVMDLDQKAVGITGLVAGDVTVSGTSTSIQVIGAPVVHFIDPPLRLPDFSLGYGLDQQIGLSTGYPPDSITLTSDDPSRVCFPVTFPINDGTCSGITTGINGAFTVRGLADSGSVQLHYSSTRSGSGSVTVQLARPQLAYRAFNVAVGNSYSIFLSYGVPGGPFPSIGLSSGSNPSTVAVSSDPKILTIGAVTAQQITGMVLAPGKVTITVTSSIADAPLSFDLTVDATSSVVLTPSSLVLGKDLQKTLSISVSGTSTQARVTSSDPSKVVVANDSRTAGSTQATGSFVYVQALTDMGSANLTLSVPGQPDVIVPVSFGPSGFAFANGSASVNALRTVQLGYSPYVLTPDTLAPVEAQSFRPGVTGLPLITSSNASAGTYGIVANGVLSFLGTTTGTTTLTLTQPDGFLAPSVRTSMRIFVNPPALPTSRPIFVGRDLQTSFNPTVSPDGSRQSTLTVRSEDPTRLLLSTNPATVGSAQVESSSGPVYLQGLASSGTVKVRVTGAGVTVDTLVTLTPSGVRLPSGSAPFTTLSGDAQYSAMLYTDTPAFASGNPLSLRPGAPPLEVGLSSSDPNVASVFPSSVTFAPGGQGFQNFTVRPQGVGTAVIAVTPPSQFQTREEVEELPVKVTLPSLRSSGSAITWKDFQTNTSIRSDYYGPQLPSTIVATITSSDPTRVLLSVNAGPGQARISIPLTGGSDTSFWIHGLVQGQTPVTISSAGFADSTMMVTVLPATIALDSPTGSLGSHRRRSSSQDSRGRVLKSPSNLRSSDSSVATVDTPLVVPDNYGSIPLPIHQLKPGKTTISVDIPDGFQGAGGTLSLELAGRLPALPVNVSGFDSHLGKNLQTSGFISTSTTPVPVTLTSSDPSKVIISSNAKTAGQATLTMNGPGSFYVQSLTDSGNATVTISSPGYEPIVRQLTFYPSAFRFDSATLNTGQSNDSPVSVALSVVSGSIADASSGWALRGGMGPVDVIINNSTPTVGAMQPSTVTFTPGDSRISSMFVPAAPGATKLTLSQPAGFAASPSLYQLLITVN